MPRDVRVEHDDTEEPGHPPFKTAQRPYRRVTTICDPVSADLRNATAKQTISSCRQKAPLLTGGILVGGLSYACRKCLNHLRGCWKRGRLGERLHEAGRVAVPGRPSCGWFGPSRWRFPRPQEAHSIYQSGTWSLAVD